MFIEEQFIKGIVLTWSEINETTCTSKLFGKVECLIHFLSIEMFILFRYSLAPTSNIFAVLLLVDIRGIIASSCWKISTCICIDGTRWFRGVRLQLKTPQEHANLQLTFSLQFLSRSCWAGDRPFINMVVNFCVHAALRQCAAYTNHGLLEVSLTALS